MGEGSAHIRSSSAIAHTPPKQQHLNATHSDRYPPSTCLSVVCLRIACRFLAVVNFDLHRQTLLALLGHALLRWHWVGALLLLLEVCLILKSLLVVSGHVGLWSSIALDASLLRDVLWHWCWSGSLRFFR